MNISKLIFKVLSADVFFKVVIAIISLLIIRYMNIKDYAIYAIVLTTLTLISTMVSSAFNRIFIVEDFEGQNINPSTFLVFQLLMICSIFVVLVPFYKLYSGLFLITLLLVISQTFIMFIQTCYQRQMKFRYYYRVEFARVFLFLLAFFYLMYSESVTAEKTILIQVITGFLTFFIFGLTLFSVKEVCKFDRLVLVYKKMCSKQVRYLFIYYLLFAVFMNCDILLLGLYSNDSTISEFAAGFRYYAIMQLALTSINKVLFPFIQKESSYLLIGKVLANHRKLAKYFLLVVMGAIFFSNWLIPLIDNGKYPNSIIVFQVLAFSSFISFLYSPYINIVLKEAYFSYILKLVLLVLPIHILANILIQHYIENIAVSIAALELCTFGIYNYLVYLKSIKILKAVNN